MATDTRYQMFALPLMSSRSSDITCLPIILHWVLLNLTLQHVRHLHQKPAHGGVLTSHVVPKQELTKPLRMIMPQRYSLSSFRMLLKSIRSKTLISVYIAHLTLLFIDANHLHRNTHRAAQKHHVRERL